MSDELNKAIMQARTDMKLTQSELAEMINEDPQVIQDYESGKAIPNQHILSKLEKALGVELRGIQIPADMEQTETILQKLVGRVQRTSGEELGAFMGAFVNITAYTVTHANKEVGIIAAGASATLMGLFIGTVFNNIVTKILTVKKEEVRCIKAFKSLPWVAAGGVLPILIGGFIPSWLTRAIVTGVATFLLKLVVATFLIRRYNVGKANGIWFVIIGIVGIVLGAGFAELLHLIGKR